MKTVEEISANQKDFYSVIADVTSYKNFLPWCTDSQIFEDTRQVHNEHEGEFKAKLGVGFKMLEFEYTSDVFYKTPSVLISVATDKESRYFD